MRLVMVLSGQRWNRPRCAALEFFCVVLRKRMRIQIAENQLTLDLAIKFAPQFSEFDFASRSEHNPQYSDLRTIFPTFDGRMITGKIESLNRSVLS